MTNDQRKRFAESLSDRSESSHDWQTVVEEGCRLLSEREAISFGHECVRRVLTVWTRLFPEDSRVSDAFDAVGKWVAGGAKAADFHALSAAASDAAVEADDPNLVPYDSTMTSAIHVANAVSSIADAVSSTCEPSDYRRLGSNGVPMAVAYATVFALNASSDMSVEQEWQRSFLSRVLKLV